MKLLGSRSLGLRMAVFAVPLALALVFSGYLTTSGSTSAASSHAPLTGTFSILSFFPQKNYNAWLRDQIALFDKKHPGVKFTVQYTDPTNIIQKVKTGVASGQAPDVATMLPGSAQLSLWNAGRLLDFTPYLAKDSQWRSWVANWKKVPNSQYRAGSHIFAANVSIAPFYIWYWKNMLAKAGFKSFPTTIAGLINLSHALRKHGMDSTVVGFNSQALFNYDYTFYSLEANYDRTGRLARLADDGKYPWTSPVFRKSVLLFKQLYDQGAFYRPALEKNYDPDSKVDFGAHKGAMGWPFGPFMDDYYPNSEVGNAGVAIFPRLQSSAPPVEASSNDLEFIIPVVTSAQQTTAHKQLMLAFVKQLNSPESQTSLWQNGIDPVMSSVTKAPSKDKWAPVLKAQINLLKNVHYYVDENTYSPNTDSALTNGLESLLLGKTSVDSLLSKVQFANKQDHSCAPKC